MTIVIEESVSFEFLDDAIINIVEGGGSDYWAVIKHWKVGDEKAGRASEAMVRSIDDPPTAYVRLDHDLIFLGINRILRGDVKVGKIVYGRILEAVRTGDGGVIDADDLDCILQAGMFNEIVYA